MIHFSANLKSGYNLENFMKVVFLETNKGNTCSNIVYWTGLSIEF